MKKTINITLNGLVFNIEEDAYSELQDYLNALKNHFGNSDHGKEVLTDIEARFAEQLNNALHHRKIEAVNMEHVREIIANMGSVADLTDSAKITDAGGSRISGKRRLYRNPDDLVVSGVASGIASYFNIDPIIPRLLFVLGAFVGGYGVLLYVILWVIIPKAQTSAQKLEMKGTPVNLANLEENARDQQVQRGQFSLIRYFIRELFYLLGRFLRALGPVILSIVGVIATAVAFVALFATTLLTTLMLFDPNSPYIDPAITQVFNGSEYVFLISSGFVSVLIPVLIGLLIGISLVRRKNSFTAPLMLTFGVLWTAAALTFGYLATSTAPQIEAAVRSIESRPEFSKEFVVDDFHAVKTQRDERIKITYGTQTKITAYGRERELDNLELMVKDGELTINHNDEFRICIFCITRPTSLEIIVPALDRVDATNASRVEISGFNGETDFAIRARNAARVQYTGRPNSMTVDSNNAARVILNGSTNALTAELTNAARLEAGQFTASQVTVSALNSSDAEVHATARLQATASGASAIRYNGSPAEEILSATNAANISKN